MTSTPRFFSTLADRTRLRIVNLLARGPLCVCNLQQVLGQPQSSVSRHLALLRSASLVRDRRDGMRTFYELTEWDKGLPRGVLDTLRRELKAEVEYGRDLDTLAVLKASGAYHQEGTDKVPAADARRRTTRLRSTTRATPAASTEARARATGAAHRRRRTSTVPSRST